MSAIAKIEEMQPGPKLDNIIAVYVMGTPNDAGKFSVKMMEAWRVLRRLDEFGWRSNLSQQSGILEDLNQMGWMVTLRNPAKLELPHATGVAESAPLAICRAALWAAVYEGWISNPG